MLLLAIAAIGFGRYLKGQAVSPTEQTVASFTRLEQKRLDRILKEGSSP